MGQKIRVDELLDGKFCCTGVSICFKSVTSQDIILSENTQPIKQRSPYKQKIIDEAIKEMLELGVIDLSKSAWSSPISLVPKPDQTFRFCADYRALNKVAKKAAYRLPYVSAILGML